MSERNSLFAGLESRYVLTGVRVTDRVLGLGRCNYAIVHEVEYKGLKCAGKRVHKVLLLSSSAPGRDRIISQFEEECHLHSLLHHPNIVQFLGIHFQQGEQLPILVMELLPIRLDACIDQYGILPKEISYSILHDVSLGLHYLHNQTYPIIHRRLTSHNIFLTSKMTAKITDFGNARIINPNVMDNIELSSGPGTLVYMRLAAYMPPEAFIQNPRYDKSIDVFCYGMIMIHVFSGEVPNPLMPPVDIDKESHQVRVLSEVERREKYLRAIGSDHLAMKLILKCIDNDPRQRPTTNEILQQLKRINQKIPSLKERLNLCKKALEEKETVDQIIMQGVFVGFPRSGKTSTKKRLMGKQPSRQQASTGVAEKASRVEIEKTTVQSLSPANWHEIDDLDEETAVITDDFELQKERARMDFIERNMKDEGDSFTQQMLEVQRPSTRQSHHTANVPEFNPASLSVILKDVETAIQKFERKYHIIRMKPWTIYLKDTGGQPEFQELLPALVSGPSLYFLFFRLDQDLNMKCLVQYQHPTSGRLIEPFEASFTMKEALLQFLASIASTRSFTKIEDSVPVTPKVLFIGTHKDKLKSEQELIKIDQDLQLAVCKTDAFREGMIEFATKDNLILAIDNFSESEVDVQNIRDVVERIGTRNEVYNVQTPYSWLLFSIILRKQHKRVLSLGTCMEIAKKCGIDTLDELQNALWFLHHNTGVVRYFQEVPTLKDVVIVEPQYIFDKLTELIVSTLAFEEVGKPQYDEFIKKGIYSSDIIHKLTSESDGLDGDKFTTLLEYLHIVAPIEEGGKITKYFAPCALSHAKPAPVSTHNDYKVPSILLTFECGYCPKGIFGFLVVKLLEKGKPSKYAWNLEQEQIFRDQLALSVGPFDSFCFRVSATFIQVDLISSLVAPDRQVSLGAVCSDVRCCIEENVKLVLEKLHYTHKAAHSLAFLCPDHHDTAEAHPATINFYDGKACSITCTLTNNKKFLLPAGHNVWFDKDANVIQNVLSMDSCSTRIPTVLWNVPTNPDQPKSTDSSDSSVLPHFHTQPTIAELSLLKTADGKKIKIIASLAPSWRDLGFLMNFDKCGKEIETIEKKYRGDPKDCCRAMFQHWLNGNGVKPCSWHKLIELIDDCDEEALAKDIQATLSASQCHK